MAKRKPKQFVPKVKYEIDMVSVFDVALASKPRAVREALRPILSKPAFKRMFGFNVINAIEKRTLKGIDKNNKRFPSPYSDQYIGSDEFKVYGKSAFKVNLRLSGEMLSSMKIGKGPVRKLKIIMADRHNNDKAHGHITGNIAKIKSKAKRDFLGLPKDEEIKIMKKTLKQFNSDSIENDVRFNENDFINPAGFTTGDDGGDNE